MPESRTGHPETSKDVPGHCRAAGSAAGTPDLAVIVDAWHRLPQGVRAGIVAIVEAASETGKQASL